MKRKYDISEHGPRATPRLAQFEGYTVGQWCPTPDGSGKPEAVVLEICKPDGIEFLIQGRRASGLALRLKSRHAINVLIEVLERHRDEVFPL